jgi:hypothetical protein
MISNCTTKGRRLGGVVLRRGVCPLTLFLCSTFELSIIHCSQKLYDICFLSFAQKVEIIIIRPEKWWYHLWRVSLNPPFHNCPSPGLIYSGRSEIWNNSLDTHSVHSSSRSWGSDLSMLRP